jgi:hypothetical protein
MNLTCPRCLCDRIDIKNYGKKTGGTIGAVAGAAVGVSSAMAGAEVGATVGMLAGAHRHRHWQHCWRYSRWPVRQCSRMRYRLPRSVKSSMTLSWINITAVIAGTPSASP